MMSTNLEDLAAQLRDALGRGRDTRQIISAIGEALADIGEALAEFPSWEPADASTGFGDMFLEDEAVGAGCGCDKHHLSPAEAPCD